MFNDNTESEEEIEISTCPPTLETTRKRGRPKKNKDKVTKQKKKQRDYPSTEDLFLVKYCADNCTRNASDIILSGKEDSTRSYCDLDPKNKNDRAKVSDRLSKLISNFGGKYPKSRNNKESQSAADHNWNLMQPYLQKIIEREKKFSTEEKIEDLEEIHNKRKEEEKKIKEMKDFQKLENDEKRRRLFQMQQERDKREKEFMEQCKKDKEKESQQIDEMVSTVKATNDSLKEILEIYKEKMKLKLELLKNNLN